MPARQSERQRQASRQGIRMLIAELLANRMLSQAGWHRLSLDSWPGQIEDDPIYWLPRELLEARREGDPSRIIYKSAYWIAFTLRDSDLDTALRGITLPKPAYYGLTGLLRYLSAFKRSRSLDAGLRLASLIAIEASRPCRRDPSLEQEAESVEDRLVKFGSVIGLVIGLLFLASMFLYDYLYIIAATLAMLAVIWYAVRSMSGKVLFLQVDMPWFECTISEETLHALARPSRPSFPLLEILDQSRRV